MCLSPFPEEVDMMRCYECDDSAVAVCRWCHVALCRKHLAKSLEARTGGYIVWCKHIMPKQEGQDGA